MALVKLLTVIGNSTGILIDKPILRMLGWDENTWVTMEPKGHQIVVRKATKEEVSAVATDGEGSTGGSPKQPQETTRSRAADPSDAPTDRISANTPTGEK